VLPPNPQVGVVAYQANAQKNIEATITAIKQAEDQMKKRRTTIEKRLKWLKTYLKTHMQQAAFNRLERGLQDITVTQLLKIAKALNIPAKDLLPDEE